MRKEKLVSCPFYSNNIPAGLQRGLSDKTASVIQQCEEMLVTGLIQKRHVRQTILPPYQLWDSSQRREYVWVIREVKVPIFYQIKSTFLAGLSVMILEFI